SSLGVEAGISFSSNKGAIMATSAPDAPNLEARLELLEKRLNRLLRLFSWFATFGICFIIWSTVNVLAPKIKLANGYYSVTANEFLLHDGHNNSRAILRVAPAGPQLTLIDAADKTRAMLGMESDAVRL